MGWLSGAIVQIVITSVVLGALKRAGVVRIDSNAIQNPATRDVFARAVDFGEVVAEKGQRLINEFTKK